MNRLIIILLLIAGSLTAALPSAAQEVTVKAGEYWIDGRFDDRTSIDLSGSWQTEIDMSALCEGVHTLGFRAADSKGRWSSPIVRYFLRAGQVTDGNTPAAYEIWTDGDFENRVTGTVADGTADLELDMSSLTAGVHTLALRVSDALGAWSTPIVRYFLVTESLPDDNAAESVNYWIDGDIASAQTARPAADGTVNLDLDMSGLCKGVHTLTLQAADSRGALGSPIVRYFLRAGRPLVDNAISAYAYWFNRGPKTRVNVDPVNPLVISDLWIDIKDIVPNEIAADYRFDTETETVYTDDNVFFGMEAYDLAGQATQAILSDTFAMTVPVRPDFTDLMSGIPVTFDAPQTGYISGFRMRADVGDSLVWTLSGGCTADAYTADGRVISWNAETNEDGRQVFGMKAETALTYVLVHHASTALDELDIVCDNTTSPSGIATRTVDCTFRADRRRLTVESSVDGELRVVSMSGVTAFSGKVEAGTKHITLPSGVYLLRWNGTTAGKLLVP